MGKKKVIVAEHIDESGIRVLGDSDLIDTIYYDDKPVSVEEMHKALKEASGVIVRIKAFTRQMIQTATHLEIIAKHGVGYDNIDVAAATERKIPVTITAGSNSDSVADYTLTLMLALTRNLLRADTDLKNGRFARRESYIGFELEGKTVGIIGLGRVGSRVAKRCSLGFGMKVLAYDPFIGDDVAKSVGAERVNELDLLLKASDYVTIHAPLTPLTQNMIGEEAFRTMKTDAFLINTARGGIVDEAALYQALAQNQIRGAGVDVFLKEPPTPDDTPLLGLNNVLVTPHLAASSKETAIKTATMAAEEVVRVLSGLRPKYVVNPEIYE